MANTTLADQDTFLAYCKERGVRPFIVGLFNYKGDISSDLPVPGFPCEHITRLDILASGKVTLCCQDQDGEYSWGDVNQQSVLEVYRGKVASRYRELHRTGRRKEAEPCGTCNVFWPSLEGMPLTTTVKYAAQAGYYFLKHRPSGRQEPSPGAQPVHADKLVQIQLRNEQRKNEERQARQQAKSGAKLAAQLEAQKAARPLNIVEG